MRRTRQKRKKKATRSQWRWWGVGTRKVKKEKRQHKLQKQNKEFKKGYGQMSNFEIEMQMFDTRLSEVHILFPLPTSQPHLLTNPPIPLFLFLPNLFFILQPLNNPQFLHFPHFSVFSSQLPNVKNKTQTKPSFSFPSFSSFFNSKGP